MKRVMLAVMVGLVVAGCKREPEPAGDGNGPGAAAEPKQAITNRVDIPAPVRRNLGVTFAKVERRNVAQTLRVPGRFELLPTARREYRAPVGGRIELMVAQYQRVESGSSLYRVDSAAWQDLHQQTAAVQAKVDSMAPIREAHRRHEQSLADKVKLWEERLRKLEEVRMAGGGSATQFTEASATLNATQAELADVIEKDAELEASQRQAEADLRSLLARRELMVKSAGCGAVAGMGEGGLLVCAAAGWGGDAGVVESLNINTGGLVEENGLVLSVVQPEKIRFRARALQSDLGRLSDGLRAVIAPPQGGSVGLAESVSGELKIGLTADADERTIDLIVEPERLAGGSWARAGVSAHLEITLAGGQAELAIPLSAVVRDGAKPIIFRRDPANPDKAIRMDADIGINDGRWVVIGSGVKEGDEIVLDGVYQLMLATAGNAPKGGHFHSDGTFHEGEH